MNSRSHDSILSAVVGRDLYAGVSAARGRRGRNRVVNFGVALLLAVLTMVHTASPAQANQSPWIPPSWVAGGAGTEWVSGTATGTGWGLIAATEGTAPGASPICWLRAVSYVGSAKPEIRFEVIEGSDCGSSSYTSSIANVIRQSSQYSCNSGGTWSNYVGNISWDRTTLTATIVQFDSICAGATKGVWWRQVGATHPDYPTRRMGVWGLELHGGSIVTLQLLCSDGVSTTLVSSSGASVSAACAAGYQVVGGSLQEDGQVVSSVAAPAGVPVAEVVACMGGGCAAALVVPGGLPCPIGDSRCADGWWRRGPTGPGSVPDQGECIWQGDGAVQLSLKIEDCIDAWWGQPVPSDPDPDGNLDLGPIEGLIQDVVDAVDKVRAGVEAARGGIEQGLEAVEKAIETGLAGLGQLIEDLFGGSDPGGGDPGGDPGGEGPGQQAGISVCGREPISTWYNPAEWAYDALACAFVPADFGASMQAGFDGLMAGDGFSVNEWGNVFSPVGDAFGGLDSAVCSCEGWQMEFPVVGTFEIGNSCTGIAKQFADLSRAATGTLIVIGGLGACVRMVAAAFGFVALVGPAVHTELKDASSQWEVYNHRGRYDEAGKSL